MNRIAVTSRRLAITIFAVALAFSVRYWLDPILKSEAPIILFYGAILFSAWYGGWPYGAIATVFAFGLSVHFFIEPRNHFTLADHADLASTVLHLFTVTLGIFLIEQLRRAQSKAKEEALERKEAEAALRRSESQLLQAQEELKSHAKELELRVEQRTNALRRSLQFMEEFLYSMAHDLRAPVRAVKGFTEALVEDYAEKLDETARDYGNRIENSCERMDRMITELLEYGRLSHTEVKLQPIRLELIMRSVMEDLNDEIAARGVRLETTAMPQSVEANDVALRQILRNLISNAMKFVPPERTPEVRVWVEEREENLLVCVQDNGIGISPEYVDKIFKPFQRLHTQDEFAGVGMGLAIARLSAERMGARLDLTSSPGVGSCFSLELKTIRKQAEAPRPKELTSVS